MKLQKVTDNIHALQTNSGLINHMAQHLINDFVCTVL